MRTNISWAFAGNSAYAGCQWLVFVLIVRVLDLRDAGQFAYWIAVTGPVFVLANVRLRNLLATAVESGTDFSAYLQARLLTTAAAVAVAVVIGRLLSSDREALLVVALIACARACDAVSDICHGLFQRELDMRTAGIGLMINATLSAGLVALGLWVRPSLAVATGLYAVASVLTLIGWDLPRMRHTVRASGGAVVTTGGLAAARSLIWRALPLGLSSAVGSLQLNLPRYVVAVYLGPAAVAVFTALAYIPMLGNLIASAVAQAALPVLARDLQISRAIYARRLRILVQSGVALGALSVAAAALLGRPVLAALYSRHIAAQLDVLIWLMFAAALTYSFLFLGTALTARLRFGTQLLITTTAFLTVASCVIPLVHRFGLRGGAYALCAGAVVEGCAYATVTVQDFRAHARRRPAAPGLLADRCSGELA
jgi:O-antigen/teichoic acid export membrane protein